MTSIDDAFATPVILVRPSSFGTETPRPRAALVVRFPGDSSMPEAALREVVLRGLLRQDWQLVAAPAGEFEPELGHHHAAAVHLAADHARITVAGQTLFDGSLGLDPGISGASWLELARSVREVLVLATVGRTPIVTATDVDAAARAGHLVGLPGRLVAPDVRD